MNKRTDVLVALNIRHKNIDLILSLRSKKDTVIPDGTG